MQTQEAQVIAHRHDQRFWHIAEAFTPVRQGTILNNYQVIGIATNNSMVLLRLSDLPNDDIIGRAAGCSLSSYTER